MNYANMIEEKRLKSFIIATLISTVIGSFTTGINLYDRFNDRHRQDRTDSTQDDKIRSLERRADRAEDALREARGGGVGGRPYLDSADADTAQILDRDLHDALTSAGPLIRQAYDSAVARLGPRLGARFVDGDLIAQNQLQAHIIDLQASVIGLLQDALATGRPPDRARLQRAVARAQRGILRTLQEQERRLLSEAEVSSAGSSRSRGRGRETPASAAASIASIASSRDRVPRYIEDAASRDRRASRSDTDLALARWSRDSARRSRRDGPHFCRYARFLQRRPDEPLTLLEDDRSPGRFSCPECRGRLALALDRSWTLRQPAGSAARAADDGRAAERVFAATNRFVAKCHRPAGLVEPADANAGWPPPLTFVCCLCAEAGEEDDESDKGDKGDEDDEKGNWPTVFRSMERLMDHVCERHDAAELLSDPDIRERR